MLCFKKKFHLTICSNNNAVPLALTKCRLSVQKLTISTDMYLNTTSEIFMNSNNNYKHSLSLYIAAAIL
jgi:hypothetical protein